MKEEIKNYLNEALRLWEFRQEKWETAKKECKDAPLCSAEEKRAFKWKNFCLEMTEQKKNFFYGAVGMCLQIDRNGTIAYLLEKELISVLDYFLIEI